MKKGKYIVEVTKTQVAYPRLKPNPSPLVLLPVYNLLSCSSALYLSCHLHLSHVLHSAIPFQETDIYESQIKG